MGAIIFVLVISAVIAAASMAGERKTTAKMTPAQLTAYRREQAAKQARLAHGPVNPAMVCSHCQVGGQVHTKPITQKKGVSGAKATGAVLTGGLSLLATGLSRKDNNTEAYCRNCSNTWFF